MSENQKKEKTFEKFYPDKEDKEKFTEIVYKQGKSKNQILRNYVKSYIKKHEKYLCKKKGDEKK